MLGRRWHTSVQGRKQIPASRIILSGDSAGGNLALALARYIHSHGAAHDLAMRGPVVEFHSDWMMASAIVMEWSFEQGRELREHERHDRLRACALYPRSMA
ncbi:alpha/beta hydrolase fold domain-containing protein [Sarocladium implicatum]|nr:alpha/beta hydrolase fold domain-containing protein [Sarocladium implicatum]